MNRLEGGRPIGTGTVAADGLQQQGAYPPSEIQGEDGQEDKERQDGEDALHQQANRTPATLVCVLVKGEVETKLEEEQSQQDQRHDDPQQEAEHLRLGDVAAVDGF